MPSETAEGIYFYIVYCRVLALFSGRSGNGSGFGNVDDSRNDLAHRKVISESLNCLYGLRGAKVE